jgi:predicted phage terminase large subunit-like protein
MPTARTISGSYSYPLAMDLSRKSRDVVLSEKWRTLFGEIQIREDQSAKGHFVNTAGGMRYATGTDGTVMGFHAHIIIVDDPLDPKRSASPAELDAANRWLTETLPTRKVDKAISATILIMQRLHKEDPAATLLAKKTPTRHINLPAEINGSGLSKVRPRKLVKQYKDGLLDPARLSRSVLNDMEEILGQYGFAGQFMQDPIPAGGGMFKTERITVEPAPPPLSTFTSLVRYWDKAATRDGGANTAGVLMGLHNTGRFWILDVKLGQWDTATRETIILQTAQLDGPKVLIGLEQEPGSGGKDSAVATIRNLAGFRVRTQRPTGDKVHRADPFSVQVNGENVSVVRAAWTIRFLDELRFFPSIGRKDQVDASSGAFSILTQRRVRVGGLGRK